MKRDDWISFVKWLINYAEGFTWVDDHINSSGYIDCPNGEDINYDDIFGPEHYPLLLHRAWDGFNRKSVVRLSKDQYAVSQKSWYGIRKEYNDFKHNESTLTIQEQAMEFLLEEMWKLKEVTNVKI